MTRRSDRGTPRDFGYRTRMRSRVLAFGVLVLLAGCEGAEAPAAPATMAVTEAPSPVPSPSPSPGATSTPWGCADPPGCYAEPVQLGSFDAEEIPEASGLAASVRNPGLFYVLDDGPDTTAVHVVRADASMVGAVEVEGMNGRDTEDMAVAPCGPGEAESCVYVGDIGDGRKRRDDIVVYRFPEPDLTAGVPDEPVEASVARYTYPDRPHEAETLLVSAAGVPYIVTKDPGQTGDEPGEGAALLYGAEEFADGVLNDLGPVAVPQPAEVVRSARRGVAVTAGDSRPGRVLLRTNDSAVEFVAPDPDADLEGFPDWPAVEVPVKRQPQPESIAYLAQGCGFISASEGTGNLWLTPCEGADLPTAPGG